MPSPTESWPSALAGARGRSQSSASRSGSARICPTSPGASDTATGLAAGPHVRQRRVPVLPATAARGGPGLPSLAHVMPSGVSELLPELIGSRQSPSVLSSFLHRSRTEAPSLHRSYPASPVLRASPPPCPARPVPRGMPVGACAPPSGLPVLPPSPSCTHAATNTPAETPGARVARFPDAGCLPRNNGGSASASSFSRPARRSLALRPACSLSRPEGGPSRRSASVHVVTSMTRSDGFRLERQLAGRASHPLGASALARRTLTGWITRGHRTPPEAHIQPRRTGSRGRKSGHRYLAHVRNSGGHQPVPTSVLAVAASRAHANSARVKLRVLHGCCHLISQRPRPAMA